MWEIIVILICFGLNGVIAATEIAFVSISKPRLRKLAEDGEKAAEKVLALRENPEKTLAVLQLGITFIGVVAAAVGGIATDQRLTPILVHRYGFSPAWTQFIIILIFVIPYTYLSIVLSELIPKSLALRNPQSVIFKSKRWLIFLGKVLAPAVYLLEKSTKWVVNTFFSWVKHEEPEAEELFYAGKLVRPYMAKLAGIEKTSLIDVMTPWSKTEKVPKEAGIEEVKKIILKTGHTRLPVVENDHAVALLHTKEFSTFLEKGDPNWQNHLRPLIQIKKDISLIQALKEMQKEHSHMSVIYENSHPIGMVTIEDILEEIVGEIYDEDDILNKK